MRTQRWPTAWLLTDERMGDRLPAALTRAAAAGAGILVRHYASPPEERRRIAAQVHALGAPLGLARDVALARELEAVLVHQPDGEPGKLPFSLSVHDEREAQVARASGAALVFVSPVYATSSHPGAQALGPERALALAELSGTAAVALGGVDAERGQVLLERGLSGWAGIDCWLEPGGLT